MSTIFRFGSNDTQAERRAREKKYPNVKKLTFSELPLPPANMKWVKNSMNNEWNLIQIGAVTAEVVDDDTIIINNNNNNNNDLELSTNPLIQLDLERVQEEEEKQKQSPSAIPVAEGIAMRSIDDDNNNNNNKIPSSVMKIVSETCSVHPEDLKEEKFIKEDADFYYHLVQDSDTFLGICLKYKTNKRELHQHNDFFDEHFYLLHELKIPKRKNAKPQMFLDGKEREIVKVTQIAKIGKLEAKTYLEMNDWNTEEAIKQAIDDNKWEKERMLLKEKNAKEKEKMKMEMETEKEEKAQLQKKFI